MGAILGESFDVVEAIRRLEARIEALERQAGEESESSRPAAARSVKAARAKSETLAEV